MLRAVSFPERDSNTDAATLVVDLDGSVKSCCSSPIRLGDDCKEAAE
jgi:hypothetical protein